MGIREETEKKVFAYMEAQGMITPGDNVVIGVSGGADSVCLLELLLAYRERVPLTLSVVHVNHMIREAAEEDARYVEELCRERGVPFVLAREDVHGRAARERRSEEDMGRQVRYGAFRQAARGLGGGKIAVAHNADDNAETMLFHLFRGSGIGGLAGIPPMRRDEIGVDVIRPLLCLERREVETYLGERGVSWRRDSTNEGDAYRRNRIRHHILPYAQQEISAGAVFHMNQTAQLLRDTKDFLEEQAQAALAGCLLPQERAAVRQVDVEAFLGCHRALQGYMLLELLKSLSPTGKDIAAVHVRDVLGLFSREGNGQTDLPFGIRARRQYGQVILERLEEGQGINEENEALPLWRERPLEVPPGEALARETFACDLGSFGKMEFCVFFRKKEQEVPRNQYTKWFDYDKIIEPVTIRPRGRGDFLTIADGKGNLAHKSLKEYMIGEKIPAGQRDEIPVVAMGNHVLWVTGRRISEHFKVREDTKHILQIRVQETKKSETEEKDVGAH